MVRPAARMGVLALLVSPVVGEPGGRLAPVDSLLWSIDRDLTGVGGSQDLESGGDDKTFLDIVKECCGGRQDRCGSPNIDKWQSTREDMLANPGLRLEEYQPPCDGDSLFCAGAVSTRY